VPARPLVPVCAFLRDEPALKFDMLADLNGVDYLNFPGARHRFAVNYGLTSVDHNRRLWLKVVPRPTARHRPRQRWNTTPRRGRPRQGRPGLNATACTGVWPGAEWMEREAYDMFGSRLHRPPDLRRSSLGTASATNPLRKDYTLRGVGERERYQIVTREGA
jgi:NADH-quinone oxidoreductase subunit C